MPGSWPTTKRASHVPSDRCRMLPAPCAALVFDFLAIAIPPIFVYDGRAVGRTKFTALITVPGVGSTGGGFY